MNKILNRISNLILLVMISGSYVMWVVGIDTSVTGWIYQNSVYLLAVLITIVLLLRIQTLNKSDYCIIVLAVLIFVFYTLTSPMRHSNRFINASISLIILLLLCFRSTKFTKLDLGLLGGISAIALLGTVYKMYVELPKLIDPSHIFQNSNKLEAIWINTNTIGMTIFLSVMMLSIILKTVDIFLVKTLIIPVYIVGFLAIWICQSKASLGALFFFVLVDNIIPKKFLKKNSFLLFAFILFFIISPFVFYQVAKLGTINLFTGRENIWAEFFEKWFSNSKNMLIGMEPFLASWKPLGTHNSFIYVLNNYGIIGYILFFGVLLYFLIMNALNRRQISGFQVSLLLAFLAICVQATMEDTLLANYWIPIVYSFVGIALEKKDMSI